MEIEFIAVSGKYVPQHDGAMDVQSLLIPVNGGERKRVSEITSSDRINLPLLVDHDPAVTSQAGTIESVWVDEEGMLRVRASLNDTDAGRLVAQLYESGDLKNSFSIGWIPESPEPDSDHVWRNAELVEISVVYAGADAGAVIPSAEMCYSALADVDICYFNRDERRAAETMAEKTEKTSASVEFGEEEISAIADAVASRIAEDGDGDAEEEEEVPEAPEAEESSAKVSAAALPQRPVLRVRNSKRESWLSSNEAVQTFADVMLTNAGSSARGLRMRWSEAAAPKLSDNDSPYTIAPGEIPLPTQIASTISDALNVAGIGLYSRLNHTGVKDALTLIMADEDQDSDSVRAHGYTVATTGDTPNEKQLEKITTSTKTITPDVVYKYVRLNRGDLLASRSTDALLNYVLSEMPNRVVQTIESRILGTTGLDDLSMYEQVTEGTEVALADTAISTLANLVDEVDGASQSKVLCISTDFKSVLNSELVTGSTTMIGYSDLPSFLGVSEVIKIPSQYSVPIYAAVINTSDYILVGDTSSSAFENFSLAYNAQEFLCELYQGGGARTFHTMAYVSGETDTTES